MKKANELAKKFTNFRVQELEDACLVDVMGAGDCVCGCGEESNGVCDCGGGDCVCGCEGNAVCEGQSPAAN